MQPLISKYIPKKIKDVKGQTQAVQALKSFVSGFSKSKKKAALLYGPSGCGKTSAVHALASDIGYEILEVNASDFRNKEHINSIVGNAIRQQSLFAKGKIILVDEVDGISGNQDRGGISSLTALLKDSPFPIVMTCQNPWDKKFSALRSKSEIIQLHGLNYLSIFSSLKGICEREGIFFDEAALKSLARRSGGDMRAAINDLQTLAEDKNKITRNAVEGLGDRNRVETIQNALLKVLKSRSPELVLGAFENVGEGLDECMLWLEENIPKEYSDPDDLAKAFDCLSRADVFRGRIRRRQHWRLLVYINSLITAGVALAKKEKYPGFTKYAPTGRILKLWQANIRYMKRKAIAEKLAALTHTSVKDALQNVLPYFQAIFRKDREFARAMTESLEFSKDEADWLSRG